MNGIEILLSYLNYKLKQRIIYVDIKKLNNLKFLRSRL